MNSELLIWLTCFWIVLPILVIIIVPNEQIDIARIVAFISSSIILLVWCNVLVSFDFSELTYQWQYFNKTTTAIIPSQIAEFTCGIDGFSLFLIILTTIIMPLCIYSSLNIIKKVKEFLICLLLIEFFFIFSFCTTDLLFFYYFLKVY